ncbi:MAG: DUF2784 domain-containing protein [Thermoguttaceae bacterium]|jgi:hypothetical protein
MILYRLAADAIVVAHAAYVAVVVGGLVLVLAGAARGWRWTRNFWFRLGHLLMIAVVAAEALAGIVCPLTNWENRLRTLGGEEGLPGSFVGRLVHRVMFYDVPHWAFKVAYSLFALAVLATLFWAPPERPSFLRRKGP